MMRQKLHEMVIAEFKTLLRCGKDFTIKSMCDDVGAKVYLEGCTVRKIVNKHYKQVITQEMVDFVDGVKWKRDKTSAYKEFSDKFDFCKRESILLIRYIKKRNE